MADVQDALPATGAVILVGEVPLLVTRGRGVFTLKPVRANALVSYFSDHHHHAAHRDSVNAGVPHFRSAIHGNAIMCSDGTIKTSECIIAGQEVVLTQSLCTVSKLNAMIPTYAVDKLIDQLVSLGTQSRGSGAATWKLYVYPGFATMGSQEVQDAVTTIDQA